MNTRLVNSAAGVIQAAQAKDRTAAGIALALESAALLMSPEVAAELERLRARVIELETRDAALLTVMTRVRDMHRSVVDADGHPTAPGCSVWGLLSDLATVRGLNRAPEHNQWSGAPYPEDDGEAQPDGITRLIAPTQALRDDVTPQVQKLRDLLAGQRSAVEDAHESPLHHSYRVGRDLPEPGGA